jgi:geranylgeranyl pyrophosphate synthase
LSIATVETPGGTLGESVGAALEGAEELLGPELAAAGHAGRLHEAPSEAVAIAALLEAAEGAEAQVHALRRPIGGDREGAIVWGLAGGWLRARAAERAAALGSAELERTSAALAGIAEGWMREARDLYDAGRSADRYLAAVEGARGDLGSVSAALGGLESGADEKAVNRLAECGSRLATAARIRDDIVELTPGPGAEDVPAGESLTRGVYSLPVIESIGRDRGLAPLLGGAIAESDLAGLVDRVWTAGGPRKASARCRRLTERAMSASVGLDAGEALAAIARRILEDCDLVVA